MVTTSLQCKHLRCTPRYIGIKVHIFKSNILPSSWQQCWAELSWFPCGKVWSVVMVLICLIWYWPFVLCALMLSYSIGTWLRFLCTHYFPSSLEYHFSYTLNCHIYISGYPDQISSKNNLIGRTVHFCIHLMACISIMAGMSWGLEFLVSGSHGIRSHDAVSEQEVRSSYKVSSPAPSGPTSSIKVPPSKCGLGTKCSSWCPCGGFSIQVTTASVLLHPFPPSVNYGPS